MSPLDCPFKTFDRLCETLDGYCIIVDFHGEATSEKNAFCHYVDGRDASQKEHFISLM